jgi:hypothetical protein
LPILQWCFTVRQSLIRQAFSSHRGRTRAQGTMESLIAIPYSLGLQFSQKLQRFSNKQRAISVSIPYSSGLRVAPGTPGYVNVADMDRVAIPYSSGLQVAPTTQDKVGPVVKAFMSRSLIH